MVSKCANPNCCKPFLHFRESALFLFETNHNSEPTDNEDSSRMRKGPRALEIFWLCATCSSSLVVRIIRGKVEVVPRDSSSNPATNMHASASGSSEWSRRSGSSNEAGQIESGRPVQSPRIRRWAVRTAVRTVAVGALLFCALGLGLGQNRPEPYTFFKEYIGLKDNQIASIELGKAVAKMLPTPDPSQIVVFGAIYINASPESYLKLLQNVHGIRNSRHYLGLQQFSTPPKLSDLEGFVLEDDDINELKSCRPGKCELQLPTASMEEFQKSVDWSAPAPDVANQVNKLAQKMALDELIQYQKDGNSALGTYYDKEHPLHVVDQFKSLLSESSALKNYLPDLDRCLIGYPQARLPNSESFFYWERVRFGLKPTLRINHMVIYRGSHLSDPVDSVAIKQLYASHYFETALDLSVCARSGRPDGKGFYLITVKGSRQAGLTGLRGGMIRSSVVSKIRSSLEASLTHVKRVLESNQ